MFSNLDAFHSYDPLEILRLIYRLFFGGAEGARDWASKMHDSLAAFFSTIPYYLINFFATYAVFAFFLSIALIVLIIVYSIRQKEIEKIIMSKVLPLEGKLHTDSEDSIMENPKWLLVQEHIGSDDASKWRLAILEADIVLSELLESLNLPGEGVGEKLKAVEAGDFETIEKAWEAHKIRNAIAHEGSDFLLTQREAKRVIKLYESVFEEFEII